MFRTIRSHEEDEKTLLDAAAPHLRAAVIALLDTACRVGEIHDSTQIG
jgi:hypothetical protein